MDVPLRRFCLPFAILAILALVECAPTGASAPAVGPAPANVRVAAPRVGAPVASASASAASRSPASSSMAQPILAPTWPKPPEQSSRWAPPRGALEEGAEDAARELFQQGVADPRGCAYHEIEILRAGVWGDSGVYETRGWILPNKAALPAAQP